MFRKKLVGDNDERLGTHTQSNGVGSCSGLVLHEEAWNREAHCDCDEEEFDQVNWKLVARREDVLPGHVDCVRCILESCPIEKVFVGLGLQFEILVVGGSRDVGLSSSISTGH